MLESLMFFIAYAFKGQLNVFAGRVKIVSHSSCRTSAILKYFCPLFSCMISIKTVDSEAVWKTVQILVSWLLTLENSAYPDQLALSEAS